MNIQRTIVPEDQRLEFLPRYFGKHYLAGEARIYDRLKEFCLDYTGGYWEFYELSNGGFYMAPTIELLRLEIPDNYYDAEMSGDAAGIVATIYVVNGMCWQYDGRDDGFSNNMGEHYYRLKDYACEHPESRQILKAID